MKITTERAITILDPEHREIYAGMEEVNEACRMGMEALKETRWRPIQEDPPTELEVVQITDGFLVCAAYLHIDGVWKLAGTDIPVTHLYPMEALTHWKPLSDPPEA